MRRYNNFIIKAIPFEILRGAEGKQKKCVGGVRDKNNICGEGAYMSRGGAGCWEKYAEGVTRKICWGTGEIQKIDIVFSCFVIQSF